MKPSRLRDRPCGFTDCAELVLRASQYCRHHLGVLHGASSARTYACSAACQGAHVRCGRYRCLTGGSHVLRLRDGLCYRAGAPTCWSQAHAGLDESAVLWTVTCLMCGRSIEQLVRPPPPGSRCARCGGSILEAEARRVTTALQLVAASSTQFVSAARSSA